MAKRYKEPEQKNKKSKPATINQKGKHEHEERNQIKLIIETPEEVRANEEKSNKRNKNNKSKSTKSRNQTKVKTNNSTKKETKKTKEENSKDIEKQKKKEEKEKDKQVKQKIKEREKRISQRKKEQIKKDKKELDDDLDIAIKMTRKNNKKEQVLNQRKQREIERKKKKRNRILKISLLLLIIIGGITFALTSPIFNIKDIQVINNTQVGTNEIISISELNLESNIFRFLKTNVENNIKQNPFIESVEIKRILPNTVQLTISERTKKFSVEFLNSYAIINTQGYILEISENNENLPILKGLTTSEEEFYAGNRLNEKDLEKVESAIKIMDVCADNNLDGLITYIDMKDESDYIIYMESEKKIIYIGNNSNISNKIIYIKAIINETKNIEGEIFVNGDLNNKFKPYFRQKV